MNVQQKYSPFPKRLSDGSTSYLDHRRRSSHIPWRGGERIIGQDYRYCYGLTCPLRTDVAVMMIFSSGLNTQSVLKRKKSYSPSPSSSLLPSPLPSSLLISPLPSLPSSPLPFPPHLSPSLLTHPAKKFSKPSTTPRGALKARMSHSFSVSSPNQEATTHNL